jgi:hypothetical protein
MGIAHPTANAFSNIAGVITLPKLENDRFY